MNSRKILLPLIIIYSVIFCMSGKAQDLEIEPLTFEQQGEIVESLISDYTPWDKVSMSGKMSSPMLPVSVSVKVYMEKDELTVISFSAMLVGEALRVEIDKEGALIVNKMKDTYIRIPADRLDSFCPGGVSAFQNLLLGRISILGEGELNAENMDSTVIYEYDGALTLMPIQDLENAPYVYFYRLNNDPVSLASFCVLSQEGAHLICDYSKEKKDRNIALDASMGRMEITGLLKLNEPDTNPKKISRIELNSRYKEVGIKELLRFL